VGNEVCFTHYKVADNAFEYWTADGKLVGTWTWVLPKN
jgi:hypothetical protein